MKLYRVLRPILAFYIWVFLRPKVAGKRNLDIPGNAIIICNHFKLHDPVIMAVLFKRPIHFMGKRELFSIPVLGALFKALGGFSVDRGKADVKAVKTAVGLLKSGEVIGMFPEGTRSRTGELAHFEPGTSMFALKAGATIVPMLIHERGYNWFHPPKITIGDHIDLNAFADKKLSAVMGDATELIESRMRAIKAEGFKG